ncbi:hypothetical protein WUBG_09611 [Wuchereria bancrofti]|uniref:Uncharacterized protein n=1 Tax=Wuchereria bancrofti TaxID=6293 RepID=J9AXY5_WUCBA|nr:hypothetical protein WUBG_09611 [Wuchereria bancrofti]
MSFSKLTSSRLPLQQRLFLERTILSPLLRTQASNTLQLQIDGIAFSNTETASFRAHFFRTVITFVKCTATTAVRVEGSPQDTTINTITDSSKCCSPPHTNEMCFMVASSDTYTHTYICMCVYIDTHTSLTVRNLIGNMTAIYDWLAAVMEGVISGQCRFACRRVSRVIRIGMTRLTTFGSCAEGTLIMV